MKQLVRVACAVTALAACSSDPAAPNAGTGGTAGPSGGAGMRASGGASAGGTSAGGTSGTSAGGTSGASAGGTSGSSAGGAGGNSAGGAPGTASSDRAACFEYVEAVCARHNECTGRALSTCLVLRDQCPDSMFSPGSTRTAASLSACAAAWATMPCGEVRTNGAPPCATLGTRPEGAECVFASQCATGFCTVNGGTQCGACGPVSDAGGPCVQGQSGCKRGLACLNGVCSPPPIEAPGGVAAPMEVCRDSAAMIDKSCTDGHQCGRFSESEPFRCHPQPGAGSPCLNADCGPGAQCASVNAAQICQALPPIGQACADRSPAVERCALDAYCSGSTCVPRIAIGATCSDSDPFMCDRAAACIEDVTSHEERCLRPREEGESCGPSDHCNPGTVCTAGVCKPSGLLGRFVAACGP